MKKSLLGSAFVFCLLNTVSVWATPIITSIVRFVEVSDTPKGLFLGPNSINVTDGPFADAVSHLLGTTNNPYNAAANQTSNIDATGNFSGHGSVVLDFNGLGPNSPFLISVAFISFDLFAPHIFTAAGRASAFMDGGQGFGGYLLFGPNTAINVFAVDFQQIVIADSVVLVPGSYQLAFGARIDSANAQGFMGGNAIYDLSFTLSAVPEPTSLALVGLGVLGVGGLRRKALCTG